VADIDDQPETDQGPDRKKWQGRLVAVLLIVAGALHAFKPQWLMLDWPSIALILVGVLLLFFPLDEIGEVIESLEIGKTKILFRKVKRLDESVNNAEMQEATTPKPALRAYGEDEIDQQIQMLLSADKEMALVKIGVELERILAELYQKAGGDIPRTRMTWRQALEFLESKGEISRATARACIEFRNVRNQLIHSSGGRVPDSVVTSAVDSGIKLLRILSHIREMNR
jgi:Sec-independent protein translocase protein TatA